MRGQNKAEDRNIKSSHKPCVFLSHRSSDKDMVRKVAQYLVNAGIDIYLDENDTELQNADSLNNHRKVTECIKKGIKNSTHVLCFLSKDTVSSWWVPFEIGYAEESSKIATLRLKEIKDHQIPSYLKIKTYLQGIEDLNHFIKEVYKEGHYDYLTESVNFSSYENKGYSPKIQKSSSVVHMLSEYLDI